MSDVIIEENGNIAIVRLNNGVTNAVSLTLVEDLAQALSTVKNEFRGMVLAGGEKFFCIGLNLPELLQLDRSDMYEFWFKFNKVTLDFYTLPIPTACAIAGHGPGAGTILALACDFRFAANEKIWVGLNEIQLGIPTPYIVDLMLRQTLNDASVNDLLYQGMLINPEKAKEIHLIHKICPKEELEEQAIEKIGGTVNFSGNAFAAIKNVKTESIRFSFEKNFKKQHEIFLDNWFSDHAQELLIKASKNF